ncbi:MAG: 4Fe-4S dicluster domain-containing protein [Proteobacteria bacterium]|nr:4Fe-4S dicluster domain-containing protein [Pseudomonadota bacterium]
MEMAKGMVLIDEDRCKACGLCIDVCPPKVLYLSEGEFNTKGYCPVRVSDNDGCTGCAACAVVCPDVVFTVYRRKRQRKARKAS